MLKLQYLDKQGVALLWSKIKNLQKNSLIYQSKTKEQWDADRDYISEPNVIYIYSDYKAIQKDNQEQIIIPGIKIGDGKTYLIDLPILNDTSGFQDLLMDHINNNIIHVSMEDRNFWDNKLNFDLQQQSQILVLNRN